MGAAASVNGKASLNKEDAKALAGEYGCEEQWDTHAVDGVLSSDKFKLVLGSISPEFIWSLYDKDGSGFVMHLFFPFLFLLSCLLLNDFFFFVSTTLIHLCLLYQVHPNKRAVQLA